MDYKDKIILAPMVRAGTLPLRLLAHRYGCDIVYTEEIIDKKIVKCTRVENEPLGTVDFMLDGKVVLRTCKEEQPCIFQMGTASPEIAVKAAQVVCKDVSGIDVNMGCPKHFSISGGMGAALLSKPETAKAILTALVKNIDLPITCKIRLLSSVEETVKFAKEMASTGIKAIAIHARHKDDRPRDAPHWEKLAKVAASDIGIPVIHNSDVYTYDDYLKAKKATGCDAIMIARGALANASIFSKSELKPQLDVAKEYLRTAISCDNLFPNTKWVLVNMLKSEMKEELGYNIQQSKSHEDLCKHMGVDYNPPKVMVERLEREQKEKELKKVTKKRKLATQ